MDNQHVPNCEAEHCIVCDSWLRELREAILPTYIWVLRERRRDPHQQTVGDYA